MTRELALVIFPGFQLLDAAGPIAAFEIAERMAPDAYSLHIVAANAGPVASSSGVEITAASLSGATYDTLLVSGGEGTRRLQELSSTVAWVRLQSAQARRVASICSGAYVLAEAGLLDGRRATTHWSRTDDFARRYPEVILEPDRIFTRDGGVWTSAGITAGIDLALALIEDDLGAAIARRTAQMLVVHHRRPGGQSQFSALPAATGGLNGRFADLLDWMRGHLSEPLGVERLAEEAGVSPRHFSRAFTAETGLTPAKAVERLRLEDARTRVEATQEPLDHIARASGFGHPERMRRAFLRAFAQPPQALRRAARL